MEPTHRFLRACRGLPVDRTPIWLMRQAGRYLPGYRAVRARCDFATLCRTPDLACEVALQPIDAFDLDAAIVFSDILLPLEAMGMRLEFAEAGPSLPEPLRERAAIDRLRIPDPAAHLSFVLEAVARTRAALAGRVPLIGFAGAPFTLAAYAVEGKGGHDFQTARRLLLADPEAARALLGKLAETVARLLAAQIAAGAECVQLFDSWAGTLSPADYAELALGPVQAAIAALRASPAFRPEVPIIYFLNGAAPHLEAAARSGADVLGIDWRLDLGEARRRLDGRPLQGNLDPVALLLPPEAMARRARAVLAGAGGRPGHIFNLGHGVLPSTPVESVRLLVDTVRGFRPEAT